MLCKKYNAVWVQGEKRKNGRQKGRKVGMKEHQWKNRWVVV